MNKTPLLPKGICSIIVKDSFFSKKSISSKSPIEKFESLYEHLIQDKFTDHGIVTKPTRRTLIEITGLKDQPEDVQIALMKVFQDVELASFTWSGEDDKPHTYIMEEALA